MNNFLSNRAMMGAAIVGLVGAAGMFMYEQIYAEKRRAMLASEMARLNKQVSSMRTELEALRELQKESNLRRQKLKAKRHHRRDHAGTKVVPAGDQLDTAGEVSYTSDSEYFTDYHSIVGTESEMDSEEFYDVHSSEDDDDTLHENLPLPVTLSNGKEEPDVRELSEKTDEVKLSPKDST